MQAALTAALYFGSFLAIGLLARLAARRWIDRGGTSLDDIRAEGSGSRQKSRGFLLGSWRNED
jgi:hypothetical protein